MLQLFAEGEAAPPCPERSADPAGGGLRHHEAGRSKSARCAAGLGRENRRAAAGKAPGRNCLCSAQNCRRCPAFARSTQAAVHSLHARWAAEEAAMRRSQPDFDLQNELRSPEMRRLMQLPGMRVRDAYRLAHYDENLRTAAQAVEQGVVERIQQRAARPTENGIRPGGAATVRPDVASMTRAQREALERRVLHGAQIEL